MSLHKYHVLTKYHPPQGYYFLFKELLGITKEDVDQEVQLAVLLNKGSYIYIKRHLFNTLKKGFTSKRYACIKEYKYSIPKTYKDDLEEEKRYKDILKLKEDIINYVRTSKDFKSKYRNDICDYLEGKYTVKEIASKNNIQRENFYKIYAPIRKCIVCKFGKQYKELFD